MTDMPINSDDQTSEDDIHTPTRRATREPITAKDKAPSEKLQKLLARTGLGSRRQMEEVIKAGRVTINHEPATVGTRVIKGDEIRVDGRFIKYKSEHEKRRRVIAYYKPEGEICSAKDPEGRQTVFDRLPPINDDRWVMVGRLDLNSSGLLLFTNDGELAHRLMHPSNEITREYAVRIMGSLAPETARILTDGVQLDDGMAKFDSIKTGGGEGVNKWYHVQLKEGRNREVRRLFESQDLRVSRLLRTHYGTMKLPKELRTGRFLELEKRDIQQLTQLVGLRGREETGLHGKSKLKQERVKKKPLKARKENSKQFSKRGNPKNERSRHDREENSHRSQGKGRSENNRFQSSSKKSDFKTRKFTKI